jgi:hypothetical protein
LSAAIRHSSGGWNPGDEPKNLDTGLRRYDVELFHEIESLILFNQIGPLSPLLDQIPGKTG